MENQSVQTQNMAQIKDVLIRGSYLTDETFADAEEAAEKQHVSFLDYLTNEGIITKDLLGQAIAESFSVPFAHLTTTPPSRDQVLRIPEKVAQKYQVVFFQETDKEFLFATTNPDNQTLHNLLVKHFHGKEVILAYGFEDDIAGNFSHYRKSLDTRLTRIMAEESMVASEIVDEIIRDAISFHASDVHFEPQEKEFIIRFRVDGMLQEAGRIPRQHYDNILNRIKVQSRMRIDEHYAAQDGSIHYPIDDIKVDLRISLIPTIDGEKIAIRILAEYVKGFSFGDLGLTSESQQMLLSAAQNPFGMVLISGPTGSGKTTTLYALLKVLNRSEVNITTIEDPIEYRIQGVNQIQVNQQTELTFAKGLRSIVRQDPDIILVGEIRDKETADIAVNAALTGHILLSSFHANDAATALSRLVEIGVEPFLLASSLQIIAAQRLVRRICSSCRQSHVKKAPELKRQFPQMKSAFSGDVTLYEGKGCSVCNHTGFKGRAAIIEFLILTPEMQDLLLTQPSTGQIQQLTKKQGNFTLFEDGMEKVKTGITTLEELLRVASPDPR